MTNNITKFLDSDLIAEPEKAEVGSPLHLRTSRCAKCGRREFPARDRCPVCREATLEHSLPSTASLSGHTSVLHPPPGSIVEAPYQVGVANFEKDGISILGQLLADPEEFEIGDPLQVVAVMLADGRMTYAYAVAAE